MSKRSFEQQVQELGFQLVRGGKHTKVVDAETGRLVGVMPRGTKSSWRGPANVLAQCRRFRREHP